MSHFDSSFFAANRERLKTLFTGTAPIVVTAAGLMQRAADEAYPFRQDADFWYLTGIDVPGAILVMDKAKEYLIIPSLDPVIETFDGTIEVEDVIRRSGVQDIYFEKDGWKQLEGRLKKVQHVATLAAQPRYDDRYGMYTNGARADLIQRVRDVNERIELLDLRQHMVRMRMVKQPAELAALQEAIDLTVDAIREVTRPSRLGKYAYEYEVEADMTRLIRRAGYRYGWPPIVASGHRACTLHYMQNDGPLASDELMVLDVGAGVDHYTADVARTVAVGGKPSRRQEQVHAAALAVYEYAISLLKPGVILNQYEKDVEMFMGEKLRELGLIKTIDHDSVRTFFPHRTSHYLGLDAHDAGDYDYPLEVGTVLVAEPGIYIPEEGIGVRIENDLLITPEGVTNLTARLPLDLC